MRTIPDWLAWVCRLILIVGVPVTLTLTNVRLLMTPTFPDIEYNMPGFPEDFYGFTQTDRLYWAKRSISYILGDPQAGDIIGWKFTDQPGVPAGMQAPPESCQYYGAEYGPRDCTFFYNDREVRHMVDVRTVVRGVLNVWALLGIASLLAIGVLAFTGRLSHLRWGLLTGAGVTWIVLIVLVAFIAIGFQQFFTLFHKVFFEGNSWIFLWSDSLIRLFPLQFWFNAFLFVGLATLAEAALVAAVAWWGLNS